MFKEIAFLGSIVFAAGCAGGGASNGGGTTSGGYMQAQRVQVSIHNGSARTVCYLRVSPVSDPNWGPDQLGRHVLNPGDSFVAALPMGGWDFRAEDCQGAEVNVLRNFTVADNVVLEIN